jgi:tetratricopeptide (TPR) repeat protein
LYMGQAIRSEKVSEEGSITKIGKAIQLNRKEGRYFNRLGQEYLILTNEEMLKGEKDMDVNKIRAYLTAGVQAGVIGRDLMPRDVNSVETLAQIYENSGIYLAEGLDSAEKEYRKALELEPNNPSLYVRLGLIKTKMAATKEKTEEKKVLVEEAKELFKQAIEVRKNFDSAYYNLASTEEALGQLDEAIEDMKKAVSLQGNNINYVFNLARMLQSRGGDDDNKVAENLFKQILGVNNNLGLLYEKTDRKAEAKAEYEKVIELLPEGSEKTKEQLEKMIENINNGIENTPENLGLTESVPAPEEGSLEPQQNQ